MLAATLDAPSTGSIHAKKQGHDSHLTPLNTVNVVLELE